MRLVLQSLLASGTVAVLCGSLLPAPSRAEPTAPVVKARLDAKRAGNNLLKPDAWRAWGKGFDRDAGLFVCNNGQDSSAHRGASQAVVLNQSRPEPIVAVAWSKAEGVNSFPNADYSLYLDLIYIDGTTLWGQVAAFDTGTHDWQRRQVIVMPEKPIRSLAFYILLRNHSGKAWFRNPELRVLRVPKDAYLFDGVPVTADRTQPGGFQVRDVAVDSDFVRLDSEALGLKLQSTTREQNGATLFDVTLSDTSGKDRAVTLIYTLPVRPDGLRWLEDPRRGETVELGREYVHASQFRVGSNGRLSYYPMGAVADASRGTALGIDMACPAFFRVGYCAGSGELYIAYDLGLTPEKPQAHLRFCRYPFEPTWGFRAAMARYYALFPEQFRCRTPKQGLWMPFAKISQVKGWEDFGFQFKEGNDETKWDDEHGIITFRYTEPMTWWMRMPKEMPRTMGAVLAEARRLAAAGDREAKALLASGYHNTSGQIPAILMDTPWCNGAVWSMNSMPGIQGEATDFGLKWNTSIRASLYGPKQQADLDGEYIDSSEGYVTDELDFRREHFAAAQTPLCFSMDEHRPAIFRGLIAFEYIHGIAQDAHAMGKLMMANATPIRLCWLAPMLEVLGTETNWNYSGKWQPMSDADLLYRRALCKGKPFCFLMNTEFDRFPPELVEKYMKRSLAYGMFPGFFSHNAAEGHYFTRPELYDRDRPLFKKYIPLCKLVAEAGWEPITKARSSDDKVYLERFGQHYLTVFNDSPQPRSVTITLEGPAPASGRELVSGKAVSWSNGKGTLTLAGDDVAVLELK